MRTADSSESKASFSREVRSQITPRKLQSHHRAQFTADGGVSANWCGSLYQLSWTSETGRRTGQTSGS